MSVISEDELPFDQWPATRHRREIKQARKAAHAEAARTQAAISVKRIHDLCARGRLAAKHVNESHVVLMHPETGRRCEFYPTRGTIVRDNVRQAYQGLSAALKTIGVIE